MEKNNSNKQKEKWHLIVSGVCLFVVGLCIGFLCLLSGSPYDDLIIPVILTIICSSIFLIKLRNKKEGSKNKGNNLPRLEYWEASILLASLCAGIVLGTYVAKYHFLPWKEQQFEHNLSGLIAPKNPENFSFIVFGDTRSEVYLRWKADQEKDIKKVLREKRYKDKSLKDSDILLDFDPRTGDLNEVKIEPLSLKMEYSNGWPIKMWKNAIKIYDHRGCKNVYKEVSELINPDISDSKHVDFAIHTGDIVLWSDKSKNEYWQKFNTEFYDKLKEGCYGKRILPVIGNHEYWRDKDKNASNFFDIFGHLKGFHYYALKYGNSFFIFLDSGELGDRDWNCPQASFQKQMGWLIKAINCAKEKGVKHIFITYHKPSFSHSEHAPLKDEENPKKWIEELKEQNRCINFTVFNGHNHTTEVYSVNDINYFTIGGSGATQYLKDENWPGQPPELYWECNRKELYNFLKVDVNGKKATFTLFNCNLEKSGEFKKEPLNEKIRVDGSQATVGLNIMEGVFKISLC